MIEHIFQVNFCCVNPLIISKLENVCGQQAFN